jgi:hypothetical protein
MIVDSIAQQAPDFRDQPLACGPRPAAEDPQHHGLEHARAKRRSCELLQVAAQLEAERQEQGDADGDGREIQLEIGDKVLLEPATPRVPGKGLAPLLPEGRVGRGLRVLGQVDLSFTRTLSLSRPVTGRLFFFW